MACADAAAGFCEGIWLAGHLHWLRGRFYSWALPVDVLRLRGLRLRRVLINA